MEKFYGMSNDYMFKAVMQERQDVLRNLIGTLLEIDEEEIEKCEILNPIVLGESIEDKTCILDTRLLLNGNRNINVELQIRSEDFWAERSLLYWARTYDDLKSGEDYNLLKPTYHIGIIDFPLYDGDKEFYSEYRILNTDNKRVYTDKFAIKVLNLRNINNPGKADEKVVHWAKIFKAKTLVELEELAGEQEVFKNMVLELRKLSEDEKIRLRAEARADYDSRMATARGAGYREGLERGIEQGEERGKELGRKEGIKEGIKEGRLQTLIDLVRQEIISTEKAAEQLGVTEQELLQMLDTNNINSDMRA